MYRADLASSDGSAVWLLQGPMSSWEALPPATTNIARASPSGEGGEPRAPSQPYQQYQLEVPPADSQRPGLLTVTTPRGRYPGDGWRRQVEDLLAAHLTPQPAAQRSVSPPVVGAGTVWVPPAAHHRQPPPLPQQEQQPTALPGRLKPALALLKAASAPAHAAARAAPGAAAAAAASLGTSGHGLLSAGDGLPAAEPPVMAGRPPAAQSVEGGSGRKRSCNAAGLEGGVGQHKRPAAGAWGPTPRLQQLGRLQLPAPAQQAAQRAPSAAQQPCSPLAQPGTPQQAEVNKQAFAAYRQVGGLAAWP